MSASSQDSSAKDPFLEDGWEDVKASLSDNIRGQVPEEDLTVNEDMQQHDSMGGEVENLHASEENGFWTAVKNTVTDSTMHTLAQDGDVEEVKREDIRQDGAISAVEKASGTTEYDVGPEKEEATNRAESIDEMLGMIDELETNAARKLDEGRLMKLGHLAVKKGEGEYDWAEFEDGNFPGRDFLTKKTRYDLFIDSYGEELMPVSGTGSFQLTMRPKVYSEEELDDLGIDDRPEGGDGWIRDFMGGGDRVGMPALSPLLYGPFQNSPIVDEDGEIEILNGRDKSYGTGFFSKWDRHSEEVDNWEEYITEHSKACYSPELSDVESWDDMIEFFGDFEWQFTNGIEASRMQIKDVDEEYDPEVDYDTVDKTYEDVGAEDAENIRVGHEKWDPIKFKEFTETGYFEGTVGIIDEDGNRSDETVAVDYRDLDEDEFRDKIEEHFHAHATTAWPSYRPRTDSPALESRDFCNSPFMKEAFATQAGGYRRWREIQEFAEEQLDISEEDATDLRIGIDREGFDYTVKSYDDKEDITLAEAWTGEHEDLDYGLTDVVKEGSAEVTDPDSEIYRPDEFEEFMHSYAENGLTAAEMTASHYGAEVDGDVWVDEEDLFVSEERQFAAS